LNSQLAEQIYRLLMHRESIGSTAVGRGLAIPHIKTPLAKRTVGIAGETPQPIAWPGATDGQPVTTVCLLITADSEQGDSLRAIENVARRFFRG
jgi:nitrogen PTS system EIIA component